jgi:hypothetical protein
MNLRSAMFHATTAIILFGCSPIVADDAEIPAEVSESTEAAATSTPEPTTTDMPPTVTPEPTQTATPTPAPPHLPADVPPGLVMLRNSSYPSLWIINQAGELQSFVDPVYEPPFQTSPDGTQLLYEYANDVWLADVTTGETRNVTNTPDRLETRAVWWPNHPDGFLCGSYDLNDESMDFAFGYLTWVNFDGTYEVLVPDARLSVAVAGSPHGKAIAYTEARYEEGQTSDLLVYRPGQGSTRIELKNYGLEISASVTDITWSPDGSKLGLSVYGRTSPDDLGRMYVLVLDLVNHTHEVLHTYEGPGCEGCPPGAPHWGPSGDWMVFLVNNGVPADISTWLSDANGTRRISPEIPKANFQRGPLWDGVPQISPDGQWVAVSMRTGVGLFRVGEWTPIEWDWAGFNDTAQHWVVAWLKVP